MNYNENARDWARWNEFVNTDAVMTREEFDSLTVAQKVALQVEAFGPAGMQAEPDQDWENETTTWTLEDGTRVQACGAHVRVLPAVGE